ncbi:MULTISPECIES: polysaccharide deacetylase family protein [unclassified Nocardia]|uniref:polysaccharide deacetylase family protein n=1 Tax=unclassified Nocardia TaxID=2637762 RepID=UPI001CE3BC70|nr:MULTISPECIES: polysaccharide deacetylase family protein [unclassified Nocardia]
MLKSVVGRALAPLAAGVGSVQLVRVDRPTVVLTYDDGPEPGSTEPVLAALADAGVTATFFVLVRRAMEQRALLNDVLAAGHEIGLHGYDHIRLTTLPATQVYRRTRDARRQLEDLCGRPVRWFRPPYGAQIASTWTAIRAAGLTPVVWSRFAGDWVDEDVRKLAGQALEGIGDGDVLLLHDGFANAADGADDGPAPTFDRGALSRLVLDGLAERGLAAASLGDALAHGSSVRNIWLVR